MQLPSAAATRQGAVLVGPPARMKRLSFAPGIFAKTYEEEIEARERQKASIDEKIKSASKLRRVEDPEELIDGMEDVLRQIAYT